MTETMTKNDPTLSSNDANLYNYTPEDAPEDVVVNIGNFALMVGALHAVSDPPRIEVGDRRRGAYYLGLVGRMPGLMPLRKVDKHRLEAVNKILDLRTGKREPDWVLQARKKSAEAGGQQPLPFNPHSDQSPLQRAAQGL